ncbi:MAG: HAMP domain-containing sensor histidine kinase [Coriobacteriales bacterium]|nr:HAMP domain-containing sensor histidine kinase [Coriobacteriales bacterium]
MIKTLKRKFVIIIMSLVSAVLITVLGSSYVSAWQTQHEIMYDALQHAIDGELNDLPRLSMRPNDAALSADEARGASILVLAIDIDEYGVVVATNQAPLLIDSSVLSELLDYVQQSQNDTEWDKSLHLAWQRAQKSSTTWRVVIADTLAIDMGLRSLAIKDLVIVCLAMAALLLISIGLSTWVLVPVEQAWEQQRRFVADASHELKTPLAVISANMQILSADTQIPTEARRWVDSTADEAEHMKGLVEELLELARTDEGSMGTAGVRQQVDVDFSSMVESCALEFDAIAFERGTSLEEDIAEGVHVVGDPEWLQRLCKILIDNACKYSDGARPVRVTLVAESRHCKLMVNNSGAPIDEEDLAHLFDRFYRTDKARSRNNGAGGFGLGLAIAKGIATSHGGDINVTSTDVQGTTFVVTLPTA